jgi:hypothetical protein
VEFYRDIKPILQRSCAACHTSRWEKEMGMLALDDETPVAISNGSKAPNVYYRLAEDYHQKSKFGYPPVWHEKRWCFPNASRYVRKFQSRRSLLVWKILGERTDGFSNDDFPTETVPGDATTLVWRGKKVEPKNERDREQVSRADLDYNGQPCPPADAVTGTYKAPDGSAIKVEALSDEDKRTIVRWIDLGCPIDLDYDPKHPDDRGYGWMLDDNRPTLAVTLPKAGNNPPVKKIVVGMHDYYTGLDEKSFSVVADVEIDGVAGGEELAGKFKPAAQGVLEWKLDKPLVILDRVTLTVSVKDRQGNISRVDRTFSVGSATARR